MQPTKGRKIGGDSHEEKPYGPSWYDVYIILSELYSKFPDKNLTVCLQRNTGVDKTAGLLVWVRDDVGRIWGSKRFLDRSPESSKTASAAFWAACTRAYHAIEEAKAIADGEYEETESREAQDDLPF